MRVCTAAHQVVVVGVVCGMCGVCVCAWCGVTRYDVSERVACTGPRSLSRLYSYAKHAGKPVHS